MVGQPGTAHDGGMSTVASPQVERPPAAAAPASAADPVVAADAVARAGREAALLPVLRPGPPGRAPEDFGATALRVQAALWGLAGRHGIALRAEASIADTARLLVGHGVLIPPAGDALRAVGPVLEAGATGRLTDRALAARAARVGDRLAAHVELRARFG